MRNSGFVGLCVMIVTLAGVLFFNVIVGVFGLDFATVGLVAFVVGVVVICRAFPAGSAEP